MTVQIYVDLGLRSSRLSTLQRRPLATTQVSTLLYFINTNLLLNHTSPLTAPPLLTSSDVGFKFQPTQLPHALPLSLERPLWATEWLVKGLVLPPLLLRRESTCSMHLATFEALLPTETRWTNQHDKLQAVLQHAQGHVKLKTKRACISGRKGQVATPRWVQSRILLRFIAGTG